MNEVCKGLLYIATLFRRLHLSAGPVLEGKLWIPPCAIVRQPLR